MYKNKQTPLHSRNKKSSDFKSEYFPKHQNFLKDQFDFSLLPKINQKTKKTNHKTHLSASKVSFSSSSLLSCSTTVSTSVFKKVPNQEVIKSKIGLMNLGDTCYLNTQLQILIHCPLFVYTLTKFSEGEITKSFIHLIKGISKGHKLISPIEFKNTFTKKHTYFSGHEQYDTLEFCRVLLDDLSQESDVSDKIDKYETLDMKGKSKSQMSKEFDMLYRKKENSFIINLFYPQIANKFTCKCGYISYSFEKMIDIPLLLPNSVCNLKLSELLEEYFKEERFKWDERCEKCKKKTVHSKQSDIIILPQILIISFQRIHFRNHIKNNSSIAFDEEINIKDFCDENFKKEECNFSLFGIAHHSGTIDFGHYYANCKIDNDWYEFNDSCVTKINKIQNISQSVYILFYIKKTL